MTKIAPPEPNSSTMAGTSSSGSAAPPSRPTPKSVQFGELSASTVPASAPRAPPKPSLKQSPPSVAETARAAIVAAGGRVSDEITSAGDDATSPAGTTTSKAGPTTSKAVARPTGEPVLDLTLGQVLLALFLTWVALMLMLIWLLRPSSFYLSTSFGVGFGVALTFCMLYYQNKKQKAEINQVLGTNVGLKGLQNLLGNLPSWLSYTEKEKMEWFNCTIIEMWPYVDKAVCKVVKTNVEDNLKNLLVQNPMVGIRSIKFKHLTFGDAPFRVESIWVNEDSSKCVEMELGIRWCGDANITLAVEVGGVVDTNKICPRVTDISFAGTVLIKLQPLVDTLPGFGAMMVTFRKQPMYKYRLHFGKALGGAAVASVVRPFIDWVVNDVIINTLVWPQRFVVPVILTNPAVDLEIERMSYRCQGVVKVKVIKATGLPSTDTVGLSDPLCEMTTDGQFIAQTKTKNDTLDPVWDETFWLVVHEPTNQEMRLWVSDQDLFSATELLNLKFSNVVGSKELMGRTVVKLAPICSQEPEPLEQWYNLGEGNWTRPEGCGKGRGRILLQSQYRSLQSFLRDEVQTATLGIFTLKIVRCSKLSQGGKPLTIYVVAKCNKSSFNSAIVTSKADHVFFGRNNKDFYDVRFDGALKLCVYEKSNLGDDVIGVLEVAVTDVAEATDFNKLTGVDEAGFLNRTLKLEECDYGTIDLQLRYIPYF